MSQLAAGYGPGWALPELGPDDGMTYEPEWTVGPPAGDLVSPFAGTPHAGAEGSEAEGSGAVRRLQSALVGAGHDADVDSAFGPPFPPSTEDVGNHAWMLPEPAADGEAAVFEPRGPFSVDAELLAWAATLAQVPQQVREALGRRAEALAVRLLVGGGAREENWLTNLVFHARHRDLGGRSIRPDEHTLAAEWQAIRDDQIRPQLAAGAVGPSSELGLPEPSAEAEQEGPGSFFGDIIRDALARNAVGKALADGKTNENELTDIGYTASGGGPIDWLHVRDRVVHLMLRERKAGLHRLVARGRPPGRPCCVIFDVRILDLSSLGTHGVGFPSDPIGQVYTRKLGFVDMGHARETADVTLWALTQLAQLASAGTDIQLFHGSARLLREIPIERKLAVAQQLAYVDSVVHEIETFGDPRAGGDNSSFSPEDLPSNIFGTLVAIAAFRQDGGSDATITQQFTNMLQAAGAQPVAVAKQVQAAAAKRKWWQAAAPDWWNSPLLKRNLTADPWLIDENGKVRIGHGALPTAPPLVSADFAYTSTDKGIKNTEFAQKIASIRLQVPQSALSP